MLNFFNHLQFGVNELLWLGYLILNFSAVALAYRFSSWENDDFVWF